MGGEGSAIYESRLKGIDALRGIAVILMIQQHLGGWLWKETWDSVIRMYSQHPLMLTLNALGMLAAPLFITLAGLGSVQFAGRHNNTDRLFLIRGGMMIAFGYALNLMTPHWFSPGSWFVLHCIGACLLLAPVLRRLPDTALLLLIPALLMGAVLLQTRLDTPLFLCKERLNDLSRPGGLLRLALAEGHFPLLPWAAFFIAGILAGRWASRKEFRNILITAVTAILLGIILWFLHSRGHAFATYGPLYRLFVFLPYFFPALPPLMLILMGTALLLARGALTMKRAAAVKDKNPLLSLGRLSLSLLVLHAVLFMEGTHLLGVHRELSKPATLAVTALSLFIFVLLALLWRRIGYRYGFEWLLRRAG